MLIYTHIHLLASSASGATQSYKADRGRAVDVGQCAKSSVPAAICPRPFRLQGLLWGLCALVGFLLLFSVHGCAPTPVAACCVPTPELACCAFEPACCNISLGSEQSQPVSVLPGVSLSNILVKSEQRPWVGALSSVSPFIILIESKQSQQLSALPSASPSKILTRPALSQPASALSSVSPCVLLADSHLPSGCPYDLWWVNALEELSDDDGLSGSPTARAWHIDLSRLRSGRPQASDPSPSSDVGTLAQASGWQTVGTPGLLFPTNSAPRGGGRAFNPNMSLRRIAEGRIAEGRIAEGRIADDGRGPALVAHYLHATAHGHVPALDVARCATRAGPQQDAAESEPMALENSADAIYHDAS